MASCIFGFIVSFIVVLCVSCTVNAESTNAATSKSKVVKFPAFPYFVKTKIMRFPLHSKMVRVKRRMAFVHEEKPDIKKQTISPVNTQQMILEPLRNIGPMSFRELGKKENVKTTFGGHDGYTAGGRHSFSTSDSSIQMSNKGSNFPQDLINGNVNLAQFINQPATAAPALSHPEKREIQPWEKLLQETSNGGFSAFNSKVKGTYEARLDPEELFNYSDDTTKTFFKDGQKRRRRHISHAKNLTNIEVTSDKSPLSYTWSKLEVPVQAFIVNLNQDGNEDEALDVEVQEAAQHVPGSNEEAQNLKTSQLDGNLQLSEEDTQINHTNIVTTHEGIPELSFEKINIEFSNDSSSQHGKHFETTLPKPAVGQEHYPKQCHQNKENEKQMLPSWQKRKASEKRSNQVKK